MRSIVIFGSLKIPLNTSILFKEKAELKKEEAKNLSLATPAPAKTAIPTTKPTLRPLGQPVSPVSHPLAFLPLTNFTARVGERFEYSFCQPAVARTSDLCTGSATNPQFGIPPYSFKYDTMGGFAPLGLTLNKNGLLAGTPTAEGNQSFKVCAVDQGGFSICPTITVNVGPKTVTPTPTPPPSTPTSAQPSKEDCYAAQKKCRLDCGITGTICNDSCNSVYKNPSQIPPGVNFEDYQRPFTDCRSTCHDNAMKCYDQCPSC